MIDVSNQELDDRIYKRVQVVLNTTRDKKWKRNELFKLGFGEVEIDIILENER